MLTNQSIRTVEPIRDELARNGLYLEPISGSILDEITGVSLAVDTKIGEVEFDEIDHATKLLSDTSEVDMEKVNEHDEISEDVVTDVAEIIEGNLHLARSKIVPAAKEVYELYTKQMDRYQIDTSQPVYIIPNVYHEIWGSYELSSAVERFANAPMEPYRFEYTMPELGFEHIRQFAKTGVDALDRLVESWFEDQDAVKVVEGYRRIFVDRSATIGKMTDVTHQTPDGLDRNDILLAFILATGFEENIPEELDLSLEQYRLYLARMREQAARVVYQEIERRSRDRNNRVLIYKVSEYLPDSISREPYRCAHVNNDVYLNFLEEGGTPEAIYGALIMDADRSYINILENKDTFEQKWNRHLSLYNQRISSLSTHYKREAIRTAMAQYINSVDEDDLPAEREHLHQRNEQCIGKYDAHYFTDEMIVIRDMVAGVFYPNTNAKMIFRAMDQIERTDPNLNARECALFATIDLIARWMASQIEVKG